MNTKIAIIAGNHLINPQKEIYFDQKALDVSIQKKLQMIDCDTEIIYLFDHWNISVEALSQKILKKSSLLKQKENLIYEVSTKMNHGEYALFESSLKQKSKNNQKKFDHILGKSSFVVRNETVVCVCWGLGVIAVLYLLENTGYEKVILVTSPDSTQLKQSDAIKMFQFFDNNQNYKDKFELVWAK